jgi:hypothetical protein
LTGKHPIRPTSTSRCPKRWRLKRGGKPLRNRPEPVQTNRATSRTNSMQTVFNMQFSNTTNRVSESGAL